MVADGDLEPRFGWSAAEAGEPPARVGGGGLHLPASLRERLVAFARSGAPCEVCGVGIGLTGEVAEFCPVANVHESPETRYEIGADDQIRLYRRAVDHGWETTLVFHSHPATEAWPSATDVALAAWPDAVYAIASLAGDEPVIRAFTIVRGTIAEVEVRDQGVPDG